MNSITQDIQSYLEAQGVAILGTNMFVGKMPDEPIDCICLYDMSGGAPRETLDGSETHWRNGLQILVRSATYADGAELAQTIAETLHGVANTIINDTKYLYIQLTSGPMSLGDMDTPEGNNDLFWQSLNFQIQRVVAEDNDTIPEEPEEPEEAESPWYLISDKSITGVPGRYITRVYLDTSYGNLVTDLPIVGTETIEINTETGGTGEVLYSGGFSSCVYNELEGGTIFYISEQLLTVLAGHYLQIQEEE